MRPGQKLTVRLIANELREAGYSADGAAQVSLLGTYKEGVQNITVRPGPQSYHAQDGATIHIAPALWIRSPTITASRCPAMSWSRCSSPASATTPTAPSAACITYDEIPPNLVQAVLAIEDRRFFEHSGVNYWRLMEAVFA